MTNLIDRKTVDEYLEKALALRSSGCRREALRFLRPYFTQARQIPALAGLIATLYWEIPDNKKAAEWFRVTTRISPKSETASLGLFHSLWALGDQRGAKAEMRRFLERAPSREYQYLRPALLDTAGANHPSLRPAPAFQTMERRALGLRRQRIRVGRMAVQRWPGLEAAYA